jgi:hypothetical protein
VLVFHVCHERKARTVAVKRAYSARHVRAGRCSSAVRPEGARDDKALVATARCTRAKEIRIAVAFARRTFFSSFRDVARLQHPGLGVFERDKESGVESPSIGSKRKAALTNPFDEKLFGHQKTGSFGEKTP